MNRTPIPRPMGLSKNLDAVHHTAWAVADAIEQNRKANPYKDAPHRIDLDRMVREHLSVLTDKPEHAQTPIHTFSVLYGAALALGYAIHQDSLEWIKRTP